VAAPVAALPGLQTDHPICDYPSEVSDAADAPGIGVTEAEANVDSYETLEIARDGAVATLTLDRSDALNAWDAQLAAELCGAIEQVARDESVRCLMVAGRGRAFSAGADVRAGFPPTVDGHWDIHTRLVEVHHPIITGLREMPKPVIAAVNGPAAGIGCSLALACDLVVAAESAYFMLAFVRIGLAPDGGASAFVQVRAGLSRGLEMALLGEPIPARKALEWGLINDVVPDDELADHAGALAARLAAGPTKAYAATKREFNAWAYSQLPAQLALEADEQQRLAATHDNAEGVNAFKEKRAAAFTGR
jgi:2-(1,2-epoxy-1,2-dihydrophenyl)acetyl-CoA isomerase